MDPTDRAIKGFYCIFSQQILAEYQTTFTYMTTTDWLWD